MPTSKMTIDELTHAHYLPSVRTSCRANTVEGYESSIAAHVLPRWEKTAIEDIRRKDIQAWVDELVVTAGPGGAWKAFKCLRQMVRWAILEWLLEIPDPTIGIKKPRGKVYRPTVLTRKELRSRQRGMRGCPYEATHVIESDLGTRPGEAYALDWEDIRWPDGRVAINKTLQEAGGALHLYPTKTPKGDRIGYLSRKARRRLHKLWKAQGCPTGRIIGGAKPSDVARTIKRWAHARNLPEINMCNLRHTFATHKLLDGTPVALVAALLGHATTDLCYQHYFDAIYAIKRKRFRLARC